MEDLRGWDELDELIDRVAWCRYLTRKIIGSALERAYVDVVPAESALEMTQ